MPVGATTSGKRLIAAALAIATAGCLGADCGSDHPPPTRRSTAAPRPIGRSLAGAITVTGATPSTADGVASEDPPAVSSQACGDRSVTITFGHERYELSFDLPVGNSTFPDAALVPVKVSYDYPGGSYEWWSGEAVAPAQGAAGMVTNAGAGGTLSMTLAAVRTAVANASGVPRTSGLVHVRASWTCAAR